MRPDRIGGISGSENVQVFRQGINSSNNTANIDLDLMPDGSLVFGQKDPAMVEKKVQTTPQTVLSSNWYHVRLWIPDQGVITGKYAVLEALAASQPGAPQNHGLPLEDPILWLSQNPASTHTLPEGSRWLLWADPKTELTRGVGRYINDQESLGVQLNQP